MTLFSSQKSRIWLITGTSSGLGLALTNYALSKGERVVATVRNPSSTKNEALSSLRARYPAEQLLIIKCDVTNLSDIQLAFQKTIESFGKCDVVVNNAGISLISEAEGTPDADARMQFEVNFWGAANVSREAVRVFRETKSNGGYMGGWLLNVTSIAGVVGVPVYSYNAASKHALEGFTEALSTEIDPNWNIKVITIEPGALRTSGLPNTKVIPPHPAYADPILKLPSQLARAWLAANQNKLPGDPRKAAEKIHELTRLTNPPRRLVLGHDAIELISKKLRRSEDELIEYESWTEGLDFEDSAENKTVFQE